MNEKEQTPFVRRTEKHRLSLSKDSRNRGTPVSVFGEFDHETL